MPAGASSADAPQRPVAWRRWVLLALALLAAGAIGAALWLDTAGGHRLIARQIAAIQPTNGMRYSVQRIEGSIFGRARLYGVAIRDPKGLVYYAPVANLDWRPFAWIANRLDIRSLDIPHSVLLKLPSPSPAGGTIRSCRASISASASLAPGGC